MSQTRVLRWPIPKPYEKQGFAVERTKKPGQSAQYRNAIWGLVDEHTPGLFTTLDEIWAEGLKLARNKQFLGWRPRIGPGKFAFHYEWITYGQADERRKNIGSALHKLFKDGTLRGEDYDTVGIWAPNRPEWQLVDIALQTYNMVGVSLYDTLGKDSVEYIINHSGLSIIFVSPDHVPALLKLSQAGKVPTLKYIVSFDALPAEAVTAIKQWADSVGNGLKVVQLNELEALGKANPADPIPATRNAVATICYTSGTTNTPKGVLLTHKALAMAVNASLFGQDIPQNSILMSYMPLAHIYERMSELLAIAFGNAIGYYSGDPLRLLEDAQILRPHVFPSVPRILNRIYQSAMVAKETPGVKGALFKKALEAKLNRLLTTGEITHAVWDRIVFKKIQAVLGGRIQFISSGSAPITPDVLNFLRISFACEVVEGYGLTETCACASRTWPADANGIGTVGPPNPVNEIKLVDVAHMGYTAEDKPYPRGELCIKGTNVFTGYYKDEKNTKEAIDSEGWFHTGDIAAVDHAGRFKIIDRVKNIMKLSQGEYVALEKVENVCSTVPIVQQAFVYGDGTQSYVVAVIVPEPVAFSGLVSKVLNKNALLKDGTPNLAVLQEAIKDKNVAAVVLELLTQEAQKNGLKGFEQVKRVHLSLSPFSVDDGTLTPTMKLRRKDAYNKYKAEIDTLYALGEPSSGAGRVGHIRL